MCPVPQRPPPSQLTPHLVRRTCPAHRSCSFLVPSVDPLSPPRLRPNALYCHPVRGSEVSRSGPFDRDTSSVSEEGARSNGRTTSQRHHHKSRKTASQSQKRGVNRDANLSWILSRHATGSTTRFHRGLLAFHRRSPWATAGAEGKAARSATAPLRGARGCALADDRLAGSSDPQARPRCAVTDLTPRRRSLYPAHNARRWQVPCRHRRNLLRSVPELRYTAASLALS